MDLPSAVGAGWDSGMEVDAINILLLMAFPSTVVAGWDLDKEDDAVNRIVDGL